MAKRYNDSRKYNDPWFRKLSPLHKCLWDYVLSTCDHAGIWKSDFELASFCIGGEINSKEAEKVFSERIVCNGGDKWFIPGFIEYQYGQLDPNNRVHNSVLRILEKEQGSFKGRLYPFKGYKDKYKDKDKVKDKEKEKKTIYGVYKNVRLTDKEHEWLNKKFGSRRRDELITELDEGIERKGYKYISHYLAILKWSDNSKPKSNLTPAQQRTKQSIEAFGDD